MPDNSFRKNERLSGSRAITGLFESNEGGFVYPFKYLVSRSVAPESQVAVLISVPKRNHKRAVKRNLIKRRTREAYRLNKSPLRQNATGRLHIALIYVSKEAEPYPVIEKAVRTIIHAITTNQL